MPPPHHMYHHRPPQYGAPPPGYPQHPPPAGHPPHAPHGPPGHAPPPHGGPPQAAPRPPDPRAEHPPAYGQHAAPHQPHHMAGQSRGPPPGSEAYAAGHRASQGGESAGAFHYSEAAPSARRQTNVALLAPAPHGYQVRLSNVPQELTAKDLAEAFGEVSASRVESVDLLRDPQGRATGESVVVFGSLADAQNAVRRYHGGDLNGRRLMAIYEGEVFSNK